jgi:glycerol-3-phosphate cytidylyltransferase-like family protein
LKYCNKFYFIFREHEWYNIKREALKQAEDMGTGILIVKENKRAELIQECTYVTEAIENVEILKFNIAKTCSKKIIYGY